MHTKDRRSFLRAATMISAAATIEALAPSVASAAETHAESNPYALESGPMPVPFLPRRGYADGPYGQVHYRDTLQGQPLVLCHQAPMTSKQFNNVLEPLQRRGIRAIAIDAPGFGESDPAPFVPTVQDWAAVVPPVLDKLGIKRADVLGHHTGGMVATEVALLYPDRVRKLIINGPLPMTMEERDGFLEGLGKREIEFVYEADGSHLQDAFANRNRLFGEGADPRLITRYTLERFQGYAPFWTGHHAAFIYDHNSSIPRIKHPTLILTNTGDVIYENAKLTHQMRPDFSYAELQGGGIDVIDQLPEQWADAVAGFLK